MFVDKFLLWKTFPICCLRWILQFAVLECPPDANLLTKGPNNRGLLDIVQHLLAVWSKSEFVQSASMEQQTCILCHSFTPHSKVHFSFSKISVTEQVVEASTLIRKNWISYVNLVLFFCVEPVALQKSSFFYYTFSSNLGSP